MKFTKATYFSLFFLFCFLASFSIGSYQNVHAKISKKIPAHSKACSLSSKEDLTTNNGDLIFEENENEKEHDFHVQSLILPHFISFFQFQAFLPEIISAAPLAKKLTNPIYVSVCNFRL